MTVYELIAERYDEIFPREESIARCLEDEFRNCSGSEKPLLDAACGTGTYAIHMAGSGFSVIGIDLDETMIQKAKVKGEKTSTPGDLQFKVLDMREIGNILEENSLGGAYCLGNSLPHLSGEREIFNFFLSLYRSLSAGSSLLIQTINFDRIPRGEIFPLPSIKNSETGLYFQRAYHPHEHPDKVRFVTRVGDQKGETVLLRTPADMLRRIAAEAGFKEIELYGSFSKDPFEPDASFVTLLSCKVLS